MSQAVDTYVGCKHRMIYSIQSRSALLLVSYVARYMVTLPYTASSRVGAKGLHQATCWPHAHSVELARSDMLA